MKKLKKINTYTHTLSFRIIGATVFWLWLFSFIISGVGYIRFTKSLTKEYNDSAFRTADTASSLVDGDKIDFYLQCGGNDAEYQSYLKRLDILCQKQNVTFIYVIVPDTSDYLSFHSVYNVVNNKTGYTPWQVGFERETTNDEYARVYRDIFENGLEQGTVVRDQGLHGREPHITSLVPIRNSLEEVTAILCVERPMSELATGRRMYLRWVAVSLAVLSILSTVLAVWYLRQQFVSPVRKIIAEAERFARDNTKNELRTLADISQIREINELGVTVEQVEEETLSYMKNLKTVTAEKERIGTELALATQIQASMLPNIFPAFPERHEFDIFASMTPAREVGGDFYDFFLIDEDHMGLVMADVSGKGIPAALFMMMTKILLQNYAMMGGTPGEVLHRLNETICKNNENDMFVTVWFGILTISERKLVAANAGHEYPAIRKSQGKFEILKDKHCFVIGGMSGARYREYELEFSKGDTLFLYTDGVPEATNAREEMFGIDRMLAALNNSPKADPSNLLSQVKDAVDTFIGDAPQFDDLTMLAIRLL